MTEGVPSQFAHVGRVIPTTQIAETCKLLVRQLKEDKGVRLKEHHSGEIRISLHEGNPSKRIKIVETKEIE